MDLLLKSFVDEGRAAGVSALVCEGGRERQFSCHGVADMGSGRAFDRDTLCHIYSMTKVFTAVAALTLVDAGLWELDQPIDEICPEYRYMLRMRRDLRGDEVDMVPCRERITIRHLLTMTSGMAYDLDESTPAERAVHDSMRPIIARMQAGERGEEAPYTAARLAHEMAGVPLLNEPGAKWHYGLSMDVLGGLIEVASGMSLGAYMKRTIFDPLRLNDTHFAVPERDRERVAGIYTLAGGALAPWPGVGGMTFTGTRELCSGGAGLVSTIGDCARFASMLALGGELDGVRVLKRESVRMMRSDMLPESAKPSFNWLEERGYTYGLGVRVMQNPSRSAYEEAPGAFGWNGLAGTSMRIYPDTGRTLIFFIQLVPAMHSRYLPALVKSANGIFMDR